MLQNITIKYKGNYTANDTYCNLAKFAEFKSDIEKPDISLFSKSTFETASEKNPFSNLIEGFEEPVTIDDDVSNNKKQDLDIDAKKTKWPHLAHFHPIYLLDSQKPHPSEIWDISDICKKPEYRESMFAKYNYRNPKPSLEIMIDNDTGLLIPGWPQIWPQDLKYSPNCNAMSKLFDVAYVNFVISLEYTWLGFSPDGIIRVKDPKDETKYKLGGIEIKCPYKKKIPTHIPHAHWDQMQGSMALSGLTFYYYIVYTPWYTCIRRIEYDNAYWTKILFPKMKKLYETMILPNKYLEYMNNKKNKTVANLMQTQPQPMTQSMTKAQPQPMQLSSCLGQENQKANENIDLNLVFDDSSGLHDDNPFLKLMRSVK